MHKRKSLHALLQSSVREYSMEAFKPRDGENLGLLAIQNVYSAVPANYEGQLSDGTWVLTRVPVEIAAHWKELIGSLRFEKLQESTSFWSAPNEAPIRRSSTTSMSGLGDTSLRLSACCSFRGFWNTTGQLS